MRKYLTILFLSEILVYNCSAQKPAETIPNFIFYNLDNQPFTNNNLTSDKETLFLFFDVTCDHCRKVIQSLNNRIDECKKLNVYLITLDDKPKIYAFLNMNAKNLLNYNNVTILQDLRDQFIKLFGPRKYPSVFLYSSDKKLLCYDDEDLYLDKFFKIINPSKK